MSVLAVPVYFEVDVTPADLMHVVEKLDPYARDGVQFTGGTPAVENGTPVRFYVVIDDPAAHGVAVAEGEVPMPERAAQRVVMPCVR